MMQRRFVLNSLRRCFSNNPATLEANGSLNPEQVVRELNRHIIGQQEAKKAVAIALRNRWRRKQLTEDMQREVLPTNILLVGPTGSGKTEIARRLAMLTNAPFVKTEATRFTETGIVGADTGEMIEDLVEAAIHIERTTARARVAETAQARAIRAIVDALIADGMTGSRAAITKQVEEGMLDSKTVRIKFSRRSSQLGIPAVVGVSKRLDAKSLNDMLSSLSDMFEDPSSQQPQVVTVEKAKHRLTEEAYSRLLDEEVIAKKARSLAEHDGIVFIDEIDKVARHSDATASWFHKGEGVQKELLALLEGTRMNTKYGSIDTDHILFICAGAFHRNKPSDLLPELQGRLPIRVTLDPLKQADLVRILKEPDYNLLRQTQALLQTEGVTLTFTEDGISELALMAAQMNDLIDNIGARRLRTVLSKVTEEISFQAHNMADQEIVIDGDAVRKSLAPLMESRDLSRFVL